MLPRWHIILGAIFTLLIWVFAPQIKPIYLGLIFGASFLIDFDHYVTGARNIRRLSLPAVLQYHREQEKRIAKEHKQGIRKKGDFHLFHTVEFLAAIAVLGIFWEAFFFIFIGMFFHSLLDIADLLHRDRFYRREYFLTNWLRKRVLGS